MEGAERQVVVGVRPRQAPPWLATMKIMTIMAAWIPLALTLLAWQAMGERTIEILIAPQSIVGERDGLLSAPLPLATRTGAPEGVIGRISTALLRLCFVTEGDRSDRAASTLVLFADGVSLGPAHSTHDSIAREGGGRFSHWGKRVYFATPARDAQPSFTVAWTAPRRGWVTVLLATMSLVAAWVAWRRTELALGAWMAPAVIRRMKIMLASTAIAGSAVLWMDADLAAWLAWWVPPGFIVATLAIGMATSIGAAIGRTPARRVRAEARARRAIEVGLLPLLVMLAMSTIVAARAGTLPSTLPGADFSIRGAVHLSDTASYLSGALSVVEGAPLPVVAARRPLLAASQGALLAIGETPQGLVVVQALVLAVSLGALGLVMAPRFGAAAAGATGMTALAWMQGALATFASEPLGCAFGATALALLLHSARRRSTVAGIAGIGAMALSAAVRPGALIAIPIMMIVVALHARPGRRWRTGAALVAAIVIVASLTTITAISLGSRGGASNANFSHTMLGLAIGSDWRGADERFAAEIAALPTEQEQSRWRWQKAGELIRREPAVFVGSLWKGLSGGVIGVPSEAWRWSRVNAVLDGAIEAPSPIGTIATLSDRGGLWSAAPWAVAALWLSVGAWSVARQWRDPVLWVVGAWSIGVLLSLPIIWVDGGWRALAGSVPLFALLLAMPAWALGRSGRSERSERDGRIVPSQLRQPGSERGAKLFERSSAMALPMLAAVLAVAPAGVMISVLSPLMPRPPVAAESRALPRGAREYIIELGRRTPRWIRRDGEVPHLHASLVPVLDALRREPDLQVLQLIDTGADRMTSALATAESLALPPGWYRVTTEPVGVEFGSWDRVTAMARIGVRP